MKDIGVTHIFTAYRLKDLFANTDNEEQAVRIAVEILRDSFIPKPEVEKTARDFVLTPGPGMEKISRNFFQPPKPLMGNFQA